MACAPTPTGREFVRIGDYRTGQFTLVAKSPDIVRLDGRMVQLARDREGRLTHTFASHLVMRRAPLKAVEELLGHSTIEMTMRYSHLSPDVRKDAVRLLDANPSDNRLTKASFLTASS